MTKVYVPTPLRPYAGGAPAVEVEAATEGRDLVVKNDVVYMKTTHGLRRIDVRVFADKQHFLTSRKG